MNTPRPGHVSGGNTFVEIMIAIALFSIGILAVCKMQNQATFGNGVSNTATHHLTMGSLCAEQLLMLPYDHPALSPGVHDRGFQGRDFIDNNTNGQVDEPGESGPFFATWSVREGFPVKGSKSVSLTIGCRGGRSRNLVLGLVKVQL